ncbi:hypothetical protein [Nocardia flavorosea]|uniref:Uncharacterized protein n=1 Tax=Nocardia flavorosea TaxID=53429 RepID=A0A846YHF0_9NOCA|nr:hypothetical protein [Nocardia flavorosea]NKY57104.1 hypothetical protein [Nocardia flavorosea]
MASSTCPGRVGPQRDHAEFLVPARPESDSDEYHQQPQGAGLGRAMEEQFEGRDAESPAVLLDVVTTSTDALTHATDALRGYSA